MSVEAMSGGSAVGAATAISTGPAISSFGGEFSVGATPSVGGAHISGFDNVAFSETFQMAAPLASSFAADKVSPNVSPFENTQVMWQTPVPETAAIDFDAELTQIHEINLAPEINFDSVLSQIQETKATPTSEISIPEIQLNSQDEAISTLDLQANNLGEEIINNDSVVNNIPLESPVIAIEPASDIKMKANSFIQEMPDVELTSPEIAQDLKLGADQQIATTTVTQQEVIADAIQAVKVEKALIAIGNSQKDAHKIALKTFTQTQERKERKTQSRTPPIEKRKAVFEHDTKADEARRNAATIAIEDIGKEVSDGENKIVTGHDLAERMPNPQPQDIKSEIVKKQDDGSYESLIKQLETTGEIYSAEEAEKIVEKSIFENHAVKSTDSQTSHAATTAEVQKVLKGGIIFENKI